VIVAETAQGRGILGVLDGSSPIGMELAGAHGLDFFTFAAVL
jgi:adenosine/AMP kinase